MIFWFQFIVKNLKVENIKEIDLAHARIQNLNSETARKFAIKYLVQTRKRHSEK